MSEINKSEETLNGALRTKVFNDLCKWLSNENNITIFAKKWFSGRNNLIILNGTTGSNGITTFMSILKSMLKMLEVEYDSVLYLKHGRYHCNTSHYVLTEEYGTTVNFTACHGNHIIVVEYHGDILSINASCPVTIINCNATFDQSDEYDNMRYNNDYISTLYDLLVEYHRK